MRRLLAPLLLALAILIASPAAAFAADYYVAVNGDDAANTGTPGSPFASVQKAVDAAAAGGGAVYVGQGTFTGNITLRNGVSLYGAGSNLTTLTVDTGRVVTISNIGAGETVIGFTITGGVAESGGGIYCLNSSPVISGNVITGNSATGSTMSIAGGGGIFCQGGAPTIRNNIISANTSGGRNPAGGGIRLWTSSAVISDNTISGNSVVGGRDTGSGGGISSYGSACTISGNRIADNRVSGDYSYGGGISADAGSPQIVDNLVTGNLADGVWSGSATGGGIHIRRSSGTVSRNVVAGNTARSDFAQGGGIAFDAGWDLFTPTISANIVTGNTADGGQSLGMGGGISSADGSPRLLGNFISGNTVVGDSGGQGGGLYCSSFWDDHVSRPIVTNNVIAGNFAGGARGAAGGGVYFNSSPAVASNNTIADNRTGGSSARAGGVAADNFWGRGWPTITNCILWGNSGAEISDVGITYSCVEGGAAGAGNVAGSPLFVNVAAGDYALSAGSAASEVASATASPTTDIRGVARPQGAGYDMGAYELAPAIPVPAPVLVSDSYTVAEDALLMGTGRGVLVNDTVAVDRGPLVASVAMPPSNGALVLAPNGSFTYLPRADWSGLDTFIYVATDASGAPSTMVAMINVVAVPDAPVLAVIGDKSVDERASLVFTAMATDVDTAAGLLSFSLGAGAPAGATIDPVSGSFMWTPTDAQGPGTYTIRVIVSDGVLVDFKDVTVTVTEVAEAPVLDAIGDKSADELAPLTFTATASDADVPADTLAFSLGAGAPAGAALDPVTGEFTWTPTEAQGPGEHDIEIIVSDGTLTDSETITVTVAELATAPVLAPIGDKSVDESTPLVFTATATDADLPAEALSFSLGAGAPAAASINDVTGGFAWTPTELDGPGSYDITVIVSDGVLTDSETITITVAEVPTAPMIAGIDDQSIDELTLLTLDVRARDADAPAQTLTFSLDPGAPEGTVIDPSGGVLTWTPTEAQGPRTFDITIRVSDGDLEDLETFSVAVAEVAEAPVLAPIGNRRANELAPFAFTATATDSDVPTDTLTFSLAAGAPAGAAIDPSTGRFTWTPTEAQGPGSYGITVVVSDGVLVDSETFAVAVAEVAAPKAPVSGSGTTGGAAEGEAAADVVAAAAQVAGGESAAAASDESAGEGDEESGDELIAVVSPEESADEESGFPWWVVWLLMALAVLGLIGWIVRRRSSAGGAS